MCNAMRVPIGIMKRPWLPGSKSLVSDQNSDNGVKRRVALRENIHLK